MSDQNQEELNKIYEAYRSQYENVGESAKVAAEKFIDEFTRQEYFVSWSVNIISAAQLPFEIRKAAAIMLDKKLLSLTSVKDLTQVEAFSYGESIIKGLCDENVHNELKKFLKQALQSICYANLERSTFGSPDANPMWAHFVPLIWDSIRTLKVSFIHGGLLALSGFISSCHISQEPAEPNADGFLSKVIELGTHLLKEYAAEEKTKSNLIMWEVLLAYFQVVKDVYQMSMKKEKRDWMTYCLSNQELQHLMLTFLTTENAQNSFGPTAIHFAHPNEMITKHMNAIRNTILEANALVTINQHYKQSLSRDKGQAVQRYKEVFNLFGQLTCQSLCSTANHSLSIHDIAGVSEVIAESLVFQLKFASNICTKDGWFYRLFLEYSDMLFKMVIIPLAKISPMEREKLETDPQEFVSYTLDLCGTHRSQTPKSEAIGLMESIVENVDGGLSKCFNILFGMLSEVIMQSPYQVLKELQSIDKLKEFSTEDFVDVALLLLSDISYTISSRDDQIGQIKGFTIGHFEKILSFNTLLLQSRVLIFFSQYSEYIFKDTSDTKYLKLLMDYITNLLLGNNVSEVVVPTQQAQNTSHRSSELHLQRRPAREHREADQIDIRQSSDAAQGHRRELVEPGAGVFLHHSGKRPSVLSAHRETSPRRCARRTR